MKTNSLSYVALILIHFILGFFIYLLSKLSIPYGLAILSISFLTILKTHNDKNQVLYIAGYIIGSEVILRMTGGYVIYEIAKYSIILFMLMGIYLSGFSKNAYTIWFFLISLIPSVFVASETLNLDSNIIKSISFNLSGPLCLGVCSLYCYQRKITLEELDNVFLAILLPLITTVTYMYFYTPSVKEIIINTESNYETSGGFGPNQVATMIGLGVFIIFTRLLFYSKDSKIIILNFVIAFVLTFRGLITFSRGGMMTAAVLIIILFITVFRNIKRSSKIKMYWMLLFSMIGLFIIWNYSSSQTSGLIDKRYANRDSLGRKENTLLTGRETIMQTEYDMFLESPIWGIGVGKSKEVRYDMFGGVIASHNELTRMLAEHGSFGIFGLLLLIITPIALYVNNKMHIYLMPCFMFWALTINHAAMRLAAPAFVYALSLLHVYAVKRPENINKIIADQHKI